MKKSLITLLLAVTTGLLSSTIWHKTLGYGSADYVTDIVVSPDNGFVCMGNTSVQASSDVYMKRLWVFKLDSLGNLVWEKIINPPAWNIQGNTEGASIVKDFNGGYLVAGNKSYYNSSTHEQINGACLYKFTEDGDTSWTKLYPQYWFFSKVTATVDTGYIVSDWSNQHQDVIRFDRDWNISWIKQGVNRRETIACRDGGYLTYGGKQDNSFNIIKYDNKWSIVWVDTLKNRKAFEISDSSVICLATSTSNKIIKYNKDGHIIFSFITQSTCNDGIETSDNSIVFIEGSGIGPVKNKDYFDNNNLIKINSIGLLEWRKSFIDFRLNCITQNSTIGYIGGGTHRHDSDYLNGLDAGILRLDLNFNCDVDTVGIVNGRDRITGCELYNYPNPFNNSTQITYTLPTDNIINLSIYNSKGELVNKLYQGKSLSGSHTVSFNATSLNSGIYFVRLSGERLLKNQKIILIK